jgi:hypothetical protein
MAQKPYKPYYTLVFVSPEKLYISHFSKNFQLLSLHEKERSSGAESLYFAIEDALLGEILGKNTWILATELGIYRIPLERRQVQTLSPAELQQVLAVEAEPLSGISAETTILSYRFVENPSPNPSLDYEVLVFPQKSLQDLNALLHRKGSKLWGLSHPGALPCLIPELEKLSHNQSWQRVEVWPDLVYALYQSSPYQPLQRLMISNAPQLVEWELEIEEWFHRQNAPLGETILVPYRNIVTTSRSFPHLLTLEIETHLTLWLSSWVRSVFSKKPANAEILRLQPSPAPLSKEVRLFLAFFLALITSGLCIGTQSLLEKKYQKGILRLNTLKHPLDHLKENQKLFQTKQSEIEELSKQLSAEEAKFSLLKEIFSRQRERFAILLTELARHCPEDILLQHLEDQQGQLLLKGVCLRPELANQYALQLKQALNTRGWQVGNAQKKRFPQKELWEFEIPLLLLLPFTKRNREPLERF